MLLLFPALVTVLALLLYLVTLYKVGWARGKYGIKAPATTGNEDFERYFRVQMNTIEQLVLFLPAMWLVAIFCNSPAIAGGLGIVWIFGRAVYAHGYYQAAEKRGPGFGIAALSTLLLLIDALVNIVLKLLGH